MIPGAIGGVLLASVAFTPTGAEPETCMVTEEVMTCPDASIDDARTNSQAVDVSMSTVQPTPVAVTRTLDPPSVVQPFAGVAVSTAEPGEQAPKLGPPPDQQKLPPGPPSRYP